MEHLLNLFLDSAEKLTPVHPRSLNRTDVWAELRLFNQGWGTGTSWTALRRLTACWQDRWIYYMPIKRYRRQMYDDASSDSSVSSRDISPSVSGREPIILALASLDYLSSRDISTSVFGGEAITLALPSLDYLSSRDISISLWRRSYNPGTGQSGLPTFKRYLHISLWRRSYNPGAGQPGLPIFRY